MHWFNRRDVLRGSSATLAALSMPDARAQISDEKSSAFPSGWQTLPLGCGGLVTGFNFADDGSIVCRSDVGNCYKFSGTTANLTDPAQHWIPLLTYKSLGSSYRGAAGTAAGAYELVVAPSLSSRLYAIIAKNGGATFTWSLYYSQDSGASWQLPPKTPLTLIMKDSGSNGTWRRVSGIIAVDPANADVVYVGMRNALASGAMAGVYRALDGVTFDPLTTDGSAKFPAATKDPGACGITFDKSQGTVVVGGQTRTRRVIVPLGGAGIYESLDGGQTFTETAVATIGRSDIAVSKLQFDFDGVAYSLVIYAGSTSVAHLWRYSGPAGTWVELSAQRYWPNSGAYPHGIAAAHACCIVVDPRKGHQGYINIFGPQGIGIGYTSTNANAASVASVRWHGGTGGQSSTLGVLGVMSA